MSKIFLNIRSHLHDRKSMLFQDSLPSVTSRQVTNRPRYQILDSRNQYRFCHIHVPEELDRLAAIQVNGEYYSFFKVVKERQKALQVAIRLVDKGHEVVITPLAKGEVIWTLEPEAWVSHASELPHADR
jgi:hypothetical protein